MPNELRGPRRSARHGLRRYIAVILFVSWILGTAAIWTEFALAPTGALATADAGKLLAIQGSRVTTTSGYFHVSADPSALRGTPMLVVRTNSMESETGLQLCTARNGRDNNWCVDISDGFAGNLSTTPFARRAWSRGAMIAILSIALALTIFGWSPAVAVASTRGVSDIDDDEPASAT